MSNQVKDIFVTTAICIDGPISGICNAIKAISENLRSNYAHHEILIVSDSSISNADEAEICNLLKNIYFVRFMKAFGIKTKNELEAIAFENAIGDIVVAGSLHEIADCQCINTFISMCCSGYDVVMSNSSISSFNLINSFFALLERVVDNVNLIPQNFTGLCCVSRRAINAAIKLPMFEKFPFVCLASALQHVQCVQVKHQVPKISLMQHARECIDLLSCGTTYIASTACVLSIIISFIACIASFFSAGSFIVPFVSMLLSTALLFISNSLQKMLRYSSSSEQYSIEYDKHSSVMLDFTELNIRSDSTSDMVNKVQTGRDR